MCFSLTICVRSAHDGLHPESHHRPRAQRDPRPVRPQQRQGQTRGKCAQLLLDLRHRPQQLVGDGEINTRFILLKASSDRNHNNTRRKYFHTPALCSQHVHHNTQQSMHANTTRVRFTLNVSIQTSLQSISRPLHTQRS